MTPAVIALRVRSGAEHLHQLGPRAIAELLLELGEAHGCTAAIVASLDRYRRLSPALVVAAGGDRFPPLLSAVPT